MHSHSTLERLASFVGILPKYMDQKGSEVRYTRDETRVAILEAMGIDASSPLRAREALEELERRVWERALPPVRVVRSDSSEATSIALRAPEAAVGAAEWKLDITLEGREPITLEGATQPEWDGRLSVTLPHAPPEGYHRLSATIQRGSTLRTGEQTLIVVPAAAPSVRDVTGQDRVFGLTANLYTVRSASNWGIGDASDLARLLEWVGEIGGAFVGVNPLHALRNRGLDVSPYSPVSRIFRNPVYLDVEAVPELVRCGPCGSRLRSREHRETLDRLRSSSRVRYEEVANAKYAFLRDLHAVFRSSEGPEAASRRQEFHEYREAGGVALERFSTFESLAEHLGTGDWRQWPARYRDPRDESVEALRGNLAEAVEFHAWLQFELERQLGYAAHAARRARVPIGIYQDLAIGAAPGGADTWSNPQLFLMRVSVGAPPDDYSARGQNWGLPPLDPRRLADDGYRHWIALLRACFRHAGALRIDHVIGLFRQFWIPEGMEGSQGAYVRFPADDLLGILALEARRNGALVVGEDLGTVPPDVPPALHQRGVLSSGVFYFEREGREYRPAAEYEPCALATANTHDMPTLEGFWRGRDVEVKREIGMIGTDEEAAEEMDSRDAERAAIRRRLREEGTLPPSAKPPRGPELRGAIHRFLCSTPAAMVGISLDDLVGEVEPVNVPAAPPDRFSAWTRKLSMPLEDLPNDPDVAAALGCEERRIARAPPEPGDPARSPE